MLVLLIMSFGFCAAVSSQLPVNQICTSGVVAWYFLFLFLPSLGGHVTLSWSEQVRVSVRACVCVCVCICVSVCHVFMQ